MKLLEDSIHVSDFNILAVVWASFAETALAKDDMGSISDLSELTELDSSEEDKSLMETALCATQAIETHDHRPYESHSSTATIACITPSGDGGSVDGVGSEKGLGKRRRNKKKSTRQATKRRCKGEGRAYARSASIISAGLATPTNFPFLELDSGGAYLGKRRKKEMEVYTVTQLRSMGFQYVSWDGSTPRPIVDQLGKVISILAGRPRNDAKWAARCVAAAALLENSHGQLPDQECHRRGKFPAEARGISHGGGQLKPGNLVHNRKTQQVLDRLRDGEDFQRIALMQASIFNTWFPRLRVEYELYLKRLLNSDESLERNWERSPWACATWNFGPSTACFPHVDEGNLAFGLCAITALGDFDPREGGHIVLWDFKIVAEFPPGSTILIPSACVKHSNTPIANGKKRYSFTQYSSGGLFRWVDLGFQTVKSFEKKEGKEGKAMRELRESDQISRAYDLFCTVDELRALHSPVDKI